MAQEEGLLPSWPPEGPPIVWRLDVGAGFSGVSVVGDRFFTLFAVEEGKATDGEYAGAFRVADGSELWRARIDDEIFSDDFGRGPRATPNLVEGTLYAQSARGRLVALRAASGEELFAIDLFEEYGFFGPQWSMMGEPPGKLQMPNWGYSATPLVEGDLVIVPTGTGKGRSLIAFDRRTGEERWTVLDQPLSYASPLGADLAGRRQVVWTADADLVGVSLSGEVLWTLPWAPTIGQPVFVPPSGVFVTTVPLAQFEGGALLLDVATVEGGAVRATPVWRNNRLKSLWASPLYYDGHIYGFDNATLRCLRAKDGEALWAQRGLGKGDLLAVDGRLIIYSDRGLLLLAEASPEGYKEKGRMKLFDAARTWTPPTLADGRLYVRADSELVQLDLRADVKEEP